MKKISVSKMREKLSDVISSIANNDAIVIQKNSKDIAVLISHQKYTELTKLEDLLYKKAVKLVSEEGFASDEESEKLINKVRLLS